ncbi:zinc transporter 10-like [Polyodon spathula]|uniref:zinc transporter 10-like n=1 Tax=Polyodon spathula TaxID=7913 RepID=UPI001B7DE9E6|nr:zinc transporter 10-like [Polyodon spathula]
MGRYTGNSCRLIVISTLTLALFLAELVIGYMGNAVTLTSDSFNVFSHLLSIIVGFFGVQLSHVHRHRRFTFGLTRGEVLGAFCNAVLATAFMFTVLVASCIRLVRARSMNNVGLVLIMGIVGLVCNIISYIVFMDCCSSSAPARPKGLVGYGYSYHTQNNPEKKRQSQATALNIRGVLLHVMGDALGSVVVVVAASIFYALPLPPDTPCNWQCYVDPSLTIIMVIIILSSAFPLIKETTAILLQMVPRGLRVDHIREALAQVPGVLSIHELHIWELAAGRNIATVHLKCGDSEVFQGVSRQVREIFHNAGLHAVTIQPEYTKEDQDLLICNAPCLSEDCRTLGCCNTTHLSTNAERSDVLGITILPEHCPSQYSRDNAVLKVTQL